MPEKIYFYILILCGIWSHGIIGALADEEIRESSDFLVRHKRVVSHVPEEDIRVNLTNAKHVVIIRYNARIMCIGSILSNYVAITAASCVPFLPHEYIILSDTTYTYRGMPHNVTDIRRHLNIALLIIHQPFVYGAFSSNIQLNVSPLFPGTIGQVNGWGFNYRCADRGTNYPEHLRSINVQIMPHRQCLNRYRPRIVISDKEVCTYHPQRHCGHTDFGAGLVVDGFLAGVFLWSGVTPNRVDPEYPDVFAVLQHSDYNQWIRSNL